VARFAEFLQEGARRLGVLGDEIVEPGGDLLDAAE
jgi:hypothetical protein